MKNTKIQCGLMLAAMLACHSANAISYQLSVLDTPILAPLINDAGTVVAGIVYVTPNIYHAVGWNGTQATDWGSLGGYSFVRDINGHGQAAGYSSNSDGKIHAVMWNGGQITDLGTPGGNGSTAMAINSKGQVVGFSQQDYVGFTPVVWNGGQATILKSLGGGPDSAALDINDSGRIAGFSMFNGNMVPVVWDGDQVIELESARVQGDARAINNLGQIAGRAYVNVAPPGDTYYQMHAVRWDNGKITDLGTLGEQFHYSEAIDINEAGQVVGYANDWFAQHSVLWQDGHTIAINSLLDPTLVAEGWDFYVSGITDSGIIEGTLRYGSGVAGWSMDRHAILTPSAVPEPSTLACLMAGLVVMGLATRRRTSVKPLT